MSALELPRNVPGLRRDIELACTVQKVTSDRALEKGAQVAHMPPCSGWAAEPDSAVLMLENMLEVQVP